MRVLRSLALLFVLGLLSATAAEAASRVFVIHGIPGVPVDVYANPSGGPIASTPTIPGFQPKQVVDVTVGAATFDIRIFAQGADPQTATPVIAVLGAVIPDNVELSILAHLDAEGEPTATVYRNDPAPVAAGWARVSVRHAAEAPAVQLAVNGVPKLALTNPYFGDLEVPATTLPLQVQTAFSGNAVTPVASLAFASGTRYFVYAIGSLTGGTLDFIIHSTR